MTTKLGFKNVLGYKSLGFALAFFKQNLFPFPFSIPLPSLISHLPHRPFSDFLSSVCPLSLPCLNTSCFPLLDYFTS